MQTDSIPQIQSLRFMLPLSEKLTHTASGITWILYNYSHFSLHRKSSHSGRVCQCPEAGNLRTGRNLRHHTKAFPSLSTARPTPIMNTSAPPPLGQLQSLDHFRIQPLPPPHPHPQEEPLLWMCSSLWGTCSAFWSCSHCCLFWLLE